jgi:peptide/nickel transport system substrate-binding protein
MKKFKAIGAALVAAALAMGTVSASEAAGSTLKLGSIGFPTSLAADQGEYGNNVWYYQAVYDTLLRKTETGTLVPGVATKWTYNAAQTVLTLDIRSGIKFTDGAPLNAAAVVKNLVANRDRNGKTANYLASMKSAVAKGTNQVVVTLKEADPAFVDYLADTSGLLQSPAAIGKASSASTPVGSGPYILDKAKTKATSTYTYKANPNYWDKANRKYDNLVINVYGDPAAMSNAIKSGAVNGGNVWSQYVTTLKSSGVKMASGYLDLQGIYFSDRKGAHKTCIADVNVRRAINSVFDRAALLKSVSQGFGKVSGQYFPSTSPAYSTALNNKYPYDMDAAKAYMAASKYASGCTITMPTLAPPFSEAAYAIIKDQLGKIGITVKEVPETFGTFITNLQAPKYDAYLMIFERSGNPWTLINFMINENATFNNDNYTESRVSSLIADFKKGSASTRTALLKALNTELVNNAWFAPWYEIQSNFAHKGITVKAAQAGNVIPFLYNIK